jgi:hypothetical protein
MWRYGVCGVGGWWVCTSNSVKSRWPLQHPALCNRHSCAYVLPPADVPACLGVDKDPNAADRLRIYRQKCATKSSGAFDQPQQWDIGIERFIGIEAPYIRHRGTGQCLTVKYGTQHWWRIGAAEQNEAHALLTVQHQPNTCLSCVSSGGGVGTKCSVGEWRVSEYRDGCCPAALAACCCPCCCLYKESSSRRKYCVVSS